ncbi:phenylalanine--tRNA ligase subunit beta-related protein [Massilia phosphatilytica]
MLPDAFQSELTSNPLGKLVQAVVSFDEYRGKGLEQDEKSLAFRLRLQDTQSTLQDDAVEAIMAALAASAQQDTAQNCVRNKGDMPDRGIGKPPRLLEPHHKSRTR